MKRSRRIGDGDEDVLAGYRRLVVRHEAEDFSAQIRVYRLDADRAQGPMLTRHRIEGELYR